MDVDEIREKLIPILRKAQAEKAVLFGSYARATHDKRSDIDLIIVDNENLPYLRRLDKYYDEITGALNMPVDLFVYKANEFEDMKQGFFVGKAVAEGITLYER